MIRELIIKNRSYRRFDSSVKIDSRTLERWIELARFSSSARNVQPLKYIVCTSEEITGKIFPCLEWAGYLTHWEGPEEGERPVAYIVMLHDRNISDARFCDDGIAAQSILLGAVDEGFGGCIIGSIDKSKLATILDLESGLEILWVLALGKPAEKVILEEVQNDRIEYWRDHQGVHHVPKRSLDELILKSL
jgi:nitroreductase